MRTAEIGPATFLAACELTPEAWASMTAGDRRRYAGLASPDAAAQARLAHAVDQHCVAAPRATAGVVDGAATGFGGVFGVVAATALIGLAASWVGSRFGGAPSRENPARRAAPATIARIARDDLGFETLETRRSDRLDFREVSAAGVRAALDDAYRAGRLRGGRNTPSELDAATRAAIARRELGFETLETRGRDRLDFRPVAVWGVRSALEAAYAAGRGRAA